jgi:hypothetical protein
VAPTDPTSCAALVVCPARAANVALLVAVLLIEEGPMPLIHRIRIVRHICRLQEPARDARALYARFIGDTTD